MATRNINKIINGFYPTVDNKELGKLYDANQVVGISNEYAREMSMEKDKRISELELVLKNIIARCEKDEASILSLSYIVRVAKESLTNK